MDRIKLDKLITENMKSIFGFALTRLGNVNEAECLASDILYGVIRSAPNLKDEERFYGFMWKVAKNCLCRLSAQKIEECKAYSRT